MGFLDDAKDKLEKVVDDHGDKIREGLDKAESVIDEKTKGKYSDKIQTGTGKAKDAMDRLAHQGDTGSAGSAGTESGGTTTPPDSPPPAS